MVSKAKKNIHLEVVLNTILDGLITIDKKGSIIDFNAAAERMFGYTPQEVIGHNVKMLMPDPYYSEHDDYLKNYRNSRERKIIGIGREVFGKRKDGSIFPMDLGVNEMEIDGQQMFVGTIRDISERKQAEEEIIRSNIELERFAYVASHDLQEPLRMVSAFTDLLKNKYDGKLDEEGIEYIDFAQKAARRMSNLVSDLLEYARIGQDAETFDWIDTNKILEMAKENLQESIETMNVEIICDRPLHLTYGNPMRLLRVFQNLIGNGIKYCDRERTPVITITSKLQDGICEICIKDNGIGMKPEYHDRIFEPFKRLHAKGEYGGTGMGLSICRRIIEGFGGSIRVESEPDKGSCFYFTLPGKPIEMQEDVTLEE